MERTRKSRKKNDSVKAYMGVMFGVLSNIQKEKKLSDICYDFNISPSAIPRMKDLGMIKLVDKIGNSHVYEAVLQPNQVTEEDARELLAAVNKKSDAQTKTGKFLRRTAGMEPLFEIEVTPVPEVQSKKKVTINIQDVNDLDYVKKVLLENRFTVEDEVIKKLMKVKSKIDKLRK